MRNYLMSNYEELFFDYKTCHNAASIDVTNDGMFNRLSADYALNDEQHAILGFSAGGAASQTKKNRPRVFVLFAQLAEAGFIGFAELTDSLVADLADALALQIHVFGYLRHRLVLLIDAEEGVHYPTLTLI